MTFIEKPWGFEELIEKNDSYVVKKLGMNKGCRCSLQYHKYKVETFYVLSGKLKLTLGDLDEEGNATNLTEQEVGPGFTITLPAYKVHRMEGLEDSEYLEASTTELDDVVRLADDYKRV